MRRYNYNPHRHVKIWLSPDKNVFLNLTNQWRLIQMRYRNPSDIIHLVYDERLLTFAANQELEIFCQKFNIIPFKIYENVFPNLQSTYEILLYDYYLEEVFHFNQGGNFGSASDKLRLLSAIYNLGTYSDFDIEVDTTHLPEIIQVKSPIILPLSTYRTNSLDTGYEHLYNSGEMFAVVNEAHAIDKITKLQKVACQLFGKQDKEIIKKSYGTIERDRGLDLILLLCKLANQFNAREVRQMINLICEEDDVFYQIIYLKKFYSINIDNIFIKDAVDSLEQSTIKNICAALRQSIELRVVQSTTEKAKNALFEMLTYSDNQLLKIYREYVRETLIEMTVVFSSGALAYMYGLLHKNIFSLDEVKNIVKPMSIYSYPEISKAFKIDNRNQFFHVSPEKHDQYLASSNSDISWTEKGYQMLLLKDKKINHAAKTIQCFFKNYCIDTEETRTLSQTV